MRTVFKLNLLILAFSISTIYAQGNISPGVSQADWDVIQSQVTSLFGAECLVSDIVNVDSAAGNRVVANGAITNPYNTLTASYIFIAREIGGETSNSHGVLGVYKTGTVIWNSDTTINCNSSIGATVTATRDLNNDGKVEIIASCFEGAMGDIEALWIFSWDGLNGNLVNDVDSQNESVLISVSSGFNFYDFDGNDVYEITGWWYPDENSEEREKIVYSWNGSLYGKWTSSPQPLPGGFYPRDRVIATLKTRISKNGDRISYKYELQSNAISKQKINEFIICTPVDSVLNYRSPDEWVFCGVIGSAIGWAGLPGFDMFIEPGKNDTSFYFESHCLPAIVVGLIRGDNGNWVVTNGDASLFTADQWYDEAKSNSLKISTIGPANPFTQFIPIKFFDTLTSYTTQSRTLGWIKDTATANKYLNYFTSAKTNLQQANIDLSRALLQKVLQDVNVDSTSAMTSEAYALIRYNTEYLLEHLEASSVNINIATGWNMVSVPLLQTNYNARDVFTGCLGDLFGYDATLGSYVIASTVEIGSGYWVYYTGSTTVGITGPIITGPITVSCGLGWNLIGSREVTIATSTLTVSDGAILGDLFRYDTALGSYVTTTTIAPGDAAWIYVTQPCTLTIP